MTPRSLLRRTGGTIAVVVAVAVAVHVARDAPASAPLQDPRAAQPVRVTEVSFAAVEAVSTFTGTIRSRHEVALGFRLPGKLVARLVDVGDPVTAGQVVARLDDTDARLELRAAEAQLTSARTDLGRATADETRARDLFAKGHVTQAALERAISAAAEALSRADQARQARDLAANRLSYMNLVAEADGTVTATRAETGEVVAAGQPVVSVAASGARDVVFALPEQERALLDSGASAALWGGTGRAYALTLRDISPDVDPVGRTYRVRMALVAPDAAAALGRTVTVRLSGPMAEPAAALPLAAVVNDGLGAAVWRLPKGADHVERLPVSLVSLEGAVARVRGALHPGDIVVSLGASKIDPDRPVRIVETQPMPES